MTTLIPHHNYLLVEVDKIEDAVTKSGLLLPTVGPQKKAATGTVIAIGEEVENFAVGDHVLFPPYVGDLHDPAGLAYNHEGRQLLFVLDQAVLATILPGEEETDDTGS